MQAAVVAVADGLACDGGNNCSEIDTYKSGSCGADNGDCDAKGFGQVLVR